MPKLAIVGTRRPSAYAYSVTTQLVKEIASRGVCIVSGLALGIDSIAQSAALDVGGKVIAVLPSGVQNVYPASHRQLAERIVNEGGALMSEYPPNDKVAFKSHFIARNRIIAGLSDAVLIPEASVKSGSLHTARFALESGIDVLAVPGHITNSQAEGCHNLLKSGATLVTSAHDILDVLHISSSDHSFAPLAAGTPQEIAVLSIIQKGIHDGDALQKASGLSIDIFNQTLTMLEITGRIKPGGGNTWFLQ